MSWNDETKQSTAFSQHAWSHKFEEDTNPLIDHDKNDKLKSLLDLDNLVYGTSSDRFVSALKSKSYTKYQSKLMRAYLKQPEQYTSLDCDRLVLTVKASEGDIARIKEKLEETEKLTDSFPFKALGSLLTITKARIGSVNGDSAGEYKKGWAANRPLYNSAYRLTVNNSYRL